MSQTVLILRGIPASGKSTFARALVAGDPSWVRVNKDDIREELLTSGWSKKAEREIVVPTRDRRITEALMAGKNVIVDDTNLEKVHTTRITELANLFDAKVETKTFYIDLKDAIERDAARPKPVGADVVTSMYNKLHPPTIPMEVIPYVETVGLSVAIICDLDGTLALFCSVIGCNCTLNHRNPYDATTAVNDTLNRVVADILEQFAISGGVKLVFMSGRDSKYKWQTTAFLDKYFSGYNYELRMRTQGDYRKDSIIKYELFNQYIRGKYNVKFVLDDRDQVVKLWRELGLTCLQVANGNF